jgi:prepilin-type processing-associated H-X9-DG protein
MRQQGLILLEILIVVAVMILLVGMTIPSFRSSREQARTVQCAGNVRQLLVGLVLYENENGSFPHAFGGSISTPPRGGYAGYPTHDRMGWWWFNYTTDYSEGNACGSSILWCPSRFVTDYRLKTDVLCGNYGVNQSVCKVSYDLHDRAELIGTSLGSADIPHPSRTLLIADSGYAMLSWWNATDKPPMELSKTLEDSAYVPGLEINTKKNLWSGFLLDALNGRHPGKKVNVGFADGCVARAHAEDLAVKSTSDGYENRSPLWTPTSVEH